MSDEFSLLDPDVAAVIAAQRLCFAATVTPEGKPNLSPKGTIRVFDAAHLFFLDIASPDTVRNLRSNPWIEINIVDQLSRRGYRFAGTATLHTDDDVYQKAVDEITAGEGAAYQVNTVVLVRVEQIKPLWSPGYQHIPDERAMRSLWLERRRALDAAFEQHVERAGAFTPPRAP